MKKKKKLNRETKKLVFTQQQKLHLTRHALLILTNDLVEFSRPGHSLLIRFPTAETHLGQGRAYSAVASSKKGG